MKIEFSEPFDIPSSTPQQRGMTRTGNYPRQGLKYARAAWKALLEKHAPVKKMEGPVSLFALLWYHTADKKNDGKFKTTRPDSTNILKLIEDTMTACGYWHDDNQVAVSYIKRCWTLSASHIEIYAETLEEK